MRKIITMASICLFAAVQIAGCGSGSTVTLPQQKNAKLVFAASTSAALPTPVRTLTFVARIPAGVSVPVAADGTPVLTTTKSGLVGGSYIPPLLTITLADAASPSGLSVGNNVRTFAEIVVSYPSDSSITETSFTSINNPPADFSATGLSGTAPNQTTAILTGLLKPSMKATTF